MSDAVKQFYEFGHREWEKTTKNRTVNICRKHCDSIQITFCDESHKLFLWGFFSKCSVVNCELFYYSPKVWNQSAQNQQEKCSLEELIKRTCLAASRSKLSESLCARIMCTWLSQGDATQIPTTGQGAALPSAYHSPCTLASLRQKNPKTKGFYCIIQESHLQVSQGLRVSRTLIGEPSPKP